MTTRRTLTEGELRELVDEMLRTAFREHSRNLEKHLRDIHERILKLEIPIVGNKG